MSRQSERELERAVERLAPGDALGARESVLVTFRDPETGERRTPEGDLVDEEAVGEAALTIKIGGDPDR